VKQVEWTEFALEDMAGLDKGMARRVKRAVERFAQTGAGNVKKLQGIDPPSIASVPAITGSASTFNGETIRILRVRNRKEAYR
jgi:hypothetical protein